MDSKFSRERRRYVRYHLKGGGVLKIEKPELRSLNVDLADISFTGFSAYIKEKIEPGTDLHFEFTTKFFSRPITGEGRVKNIRVITQTFFRIGIEFVTVDKGVIQSILIAVQRTIAFEKAKKTRSQKSSFGEGEF